MTTNKDSAAHKFLTMLRDRSANGVLSAFARAEMMLEQDWDREETYYSFEDGSQLVVCNQDVDIRWPVDVFGAIVEFTAALAYTDDELVEQIYNADGYEFTTAQDWCDAYDTAHFEKYGKQWTVA